MTVIKQLYNRIFCFFKYLFFYIGASMIVIFIFAIILKKSGDLSPIHTSISFFWGIGTSDSTNLFFVELIEKMCADIFSVAFVGVFLASLLNPINPIIADDHIVYNKGDYQFRFWIMLPKGHFYYNLKFRLLLTNEEAFHRGENKLEALYEYMFCGQIIRGIHSISLDEKESRMLREKIEQLKNKHSEWHILCIISVESESGVKYNKMIKYHEDDVLENCVFVPTRTVEIERLLNNNETASAFNYVAPKREIRRYENFGKIYNLSSDDSEDGSKKPRYILTRKQLEKGAYNWPLSWGVELVNIIARKIIG